MVSPDSLLLFIAASTLLGLSPGPDNLYVAGYALSRGYRDGLSITLGLCTGLMLHTAAAVVGLSLLISQSPLTFNAIRYLGALYLLFLAWQMLHSSRNGGVVTAAPLSQWKLFRRGLLMNLSNPKVILFFVAFLPQFIDGARSSASLLLLGGVFIMVTLLVFGTIAYLADHLGSAFVVNGTRQRWVGRATALLFTLLASKLLIDW